MAKMRGKSKNSDERVPPPPSFTREEIGRAPQTVFDELRATLDAVDLIAICADPVAADLDYRALTRQIRELAFRIRRDCPHLPPLPSCPELGQTVSATAAQNYAEAIRGWHGALEMLPTIPVLPCAPTVAETISLDDEDRRILHALAEGRPMVLTQDQIAAASYVSRRTVSVRLQCLVKARLASRPKGPKGGTTITPEGMDLLRPADGEANDAP